MGSFENYQKGLLGAEAFGRPEPQDDMELDRPMQFSQPENFQDKAIRLVVDYIQSRLEKTDPQPEYVTFVVWFTKTLKNWKALVSTTLPDGMYYEVTYNGDKCETYIDAYKKFDNVCVKD